MDCLCRPSRILTVRIVLLDETDFTYELKDDLPGQALLDVIFARLNLIETAYFGIRYIDEENQTHWVDPASRISRQLKYKSEPFDLYFGVKFYAADPCKLLEEITRYQLFLQVKQDVLQGRLPVSFELAAELGAFVVQSELGDYDLRRHSKGYVSEFRLMPNQTSELETRVGELHQQLKGMPPATAELNYLDKVKWHDMYGVDLHPVLGEDSVEYFLGLTPSGIVVLRNKTTVAHYYWPRIAKVYNKGRYFMLRICDKNNELSTYGFETPRKSACKHLWRCCVEHHAFFRLVRVAPLQSQTGTSDLFALGSRLRYSGRTEKQVAKDALSAGRAPPAFTRMPSKRQPRRMIDDFLSANKTFDSFSKTQEIKTIAIPQQSYESPYRSTYSIPTTLAIHSNNGTNQYQYSHTAPVTPDSPRSTRSAPWPRSQQRGLFGGNPSSPRSVRSISTRHSTHVPTHRYRSSSVESHSSNDSRSTRRQKHRHRRTSDNESELSRGSGRSGRSHQSHRKHRRSRHRRDSGSENDSTRARSYSGHRVSCGGSSELIDSTSQWREVQRRQADSHGQSSVQQASVTKSSMVARSLHSNDSHSDSHSHHKSRRHKKNKSPSDSRSRIWSSELAKHLQFDLVDTAGMTEDQLREIPYTVVETNHAKRTNASNMKVHKGASGVVNSIVGNGGNSNKSQGKDRVDRIRGLYFQSTNPNDSSGTKNGSIRSASTISSRECERNSGLVRMMSSMSMGDFISPSASSLSPLENSALRVSHEHTDSGLGADQDYAYSSERSSDSARYGTNKSSGASTSSNRKSTGSHFSNMIHQHNHTVSNSTWKPSIYPNLQQTSIQSSYKYSPSGPALVHNTNKPNPFTNNNNNNINNNMSQSRLNPPLSSASISSLQLATAANAVASTIANNNRLINYTTFENNHYKFSLNSPNIKNSLNYNDDRPQSSASYYYPGSGFRTSRGTKSDIGVPIRRQTKSNYNMVTRTKLPSVKSDLALSNHENFSTDDGNASISLSTSVNSNMPAYHITGSKTTNFSTDYKLDNNIKPILNYNSNKMNSIKRNRNWSEDSNQSSKPSDVMYYQFDNKSTCLQNHKPTLRQSTSDPTSTTNHNKLLYGPLVFLDNKQQLGPEYSKSSSTPNTDIQQRLNSSFSEGIMDVTTLSPSMKSMTQHFTHNQNHNMFNDSCLNNDCNPNRSSSLEIILTPIIQSSRRMQ